MKFNMEPSAEALERYLAEFAPYDDIFMTLFSHGVECIGLPPIDRWRDILAGARDNGAFPGVDQGSYPLHFDHMGRYHDELQKIPARYAMPGYIGLGQFDTFLAEQGDRYPVRFAEPDEEVPAPTQASTAKWG